MSFHVRPIEPDRDTAAFCQLRRLVEGEALPVEEQLHRDRTIPLDTIRHRLVAEQNGEVVGMASVVRHAWWGPGYGNLMLAVEEPARGQGIGTALLDAISNLAEDAGIRTVNLDVMESCPEGLRFVTSKGFTEFCRVYESALPIATVDASSLAATLQGHTVLTWSELEQTDAEKRRLYDLFAEAERDEPMTPVFGVIRYDAYLELLGSPSMQAGETFIVVVDGEFAAMSSIVPAERGFFNEFTGTGRKFRGRGLAQVAKAAATRFAVEKGGAEIRTNNHSSNAAMLAINKKMGYRSEPGSIWFRRDFTSKENT